MLGVKQEIVKLSDLREFYASSNGDRWLLGRRAGTREAYVVHQANVPSGGARTDLDLDAFLGQAPESPQREALLRLIGTLLNGPKGDPEWLPDGGLQAS
jgi:hypothetical protein